jgi:hypothetical protein
VIFVAIQFDRQPSVVGTFDNKVDRVAPDRNLRTDAIAEIEQAPAKVALKLRLANFENLFRSDQVALHRRSEMLDQSEFKVARSKVARSDRANKDQSIACAGSGNVETLLKQSGGLRHRCFGAGDDRKEHDVPLLSLEGRGVPAHDPVPLNYLCSKLGDKPGVDAVRLGVADERDHADAAPLEHRVSNHLSDFCDDHIDFRFIYLSDPPPVRDIQIDQWGARRSDAVGSRSGIKGFG